MASELKSLKIRIGGILESQPFPYTYEEQFVLRLPPSLATQLQDELAESNQPEDLVITFTDARRASVVLHGRPLVGVLLDLPAIIESHKTVDRSQYYKIADISQMLLVMVPGPETEEQIKEYEALGWQHPDGLTPPLKGVRSRRFRKTLSYGQQKDVEAIERRVQALLDRDSAALSSTFTVYDSQGRAVLHGGTDGKFLKAAPSGEGALPADDYEDAADGEDHAGGDTDDDDFAAELEEEMMLADEPSEMVENTEDELFSGETILEVPSAVSPAVMELQTKINERKAQLGSVTNPLIRARLEDVIRQLETDLQSRLGNL